MNVHGKSVAVLGGDRRMAEAVRYLLQEGVDVRTVALPCDGRTMRIRSRATAREALEGAHLALLPVQGVSDSGLVFTQSGANGDCTVDVAGLRRMMPGAMVFAGIGNDYLRAACMEAGVCLVEYREADEFAIWNSIPSAEGAIQMAMEDSPYTLFGSRALVLGFGRTGRALALLLRGLVVDVTVAVRRELDFARVWAAGYKYIRLSDLASGVSEADFIFNSIPAQVLTREVLQAAPSHAVVIDVASAPGGTDFGAARELGIGARLAPGLPGIVAPATAGKIIAGLILRHLADEKREEGES